MVRRDLAQEYVQVSNLGTASCRHGPRPEEAGHGHDISALNESKSKYQAGPLTASLAASAPTCRSGRSPAGTRVTARHASSRNHRWRVQRQRVRRERNKRMFRTRNAPACFCWGRCRPGVGSHRRASRRPALRGPPGRRRRSAPFLPLAHQSTAALARPLAERAPGSPSTHRVPVPAPSTPPRPPARA